MTTPTPVPSLGMVSVVGVVSSQVCAGLADGSFYCWGGNQYGQLGDGTTVDKSSPVEIPLIPPVTAIEGDFHTCVVGSDGSVWCWGLNDYGQLGDGTTTNKSTPVAVSALGSSVEEIGGGYPFTCARTSDGKAYCWGGNYVGQLGDGTTVSKSTPTQVAALGSDVAQVAVGGEFACARKSDDTLWCWGQNNHGQLGDGTTEDKTSPVQVATLGANVVEVATGSSNACARTKDDKVYCWGNNDFGQLGDGTTETKTSPVPLGICP